MKYFVMVAFALTLGRAKAQETDTSKLIINNRVVWGVQLGLTQSQLRGQDIGKLSSNGASTPILGPHFGVTLNAMLSDHFWLKHELMMTQKGAGITLMDSINGEYKSDLKWWSIDLFPISPCWRYNGFRAYAGPYLSVLVDARIRKKNANGAFENDHSIFGSGRSFQNQSNYMQKFDYGFNVGLEYQFRNGFNISAKYTRGFAELLDWANSITIGKPSDPTSISIYNEYLNFSIGYNFIKTR